MLSSQTSACRLAIDSAPPVVRIVLRNPPLNVIDIPMMGELARSLADIETQADISVIVLSGEGKSFSAGVDVAAHVPETIERMLSCFHQIIRALIASKKVTIASVHGNCLGGGAELAMVCDLAFTTDTAQWGFPEIKLGCYPPVACVALAALVGQKRAAELILTGRTISGKQAADIGLANASVSDSDLDARVEECITSLRKLSPATLAFTKKAFYAWDAMHFDKGLARAERVYLDELIHNEDAHEGIRAFMEKRSPKWAGR